MSQISGQVAPGFEKVRDAFEANFAEDSVWPEVGAGYVVYVAGQKVVDLYGGVADVETGTPWTEDTVANVFSSTKVMPSLAIAQLVDEGRLSYNDPIAKYWPEFGCNGKEEATIGQALAHISGVNAFEEPLTIEDLVDWEASCKRLETQTPTFKPGETSAYHALTHGHLTMEVVRRVTGMGPAEYVEKRISGPLGVDFQIGAKEADWGRIAKLVPPPPPPADMPKPDPRAGKAIMNPMVTPPLTATPAWRNAQIPAANGHASARGIARLWAAIANGGELDGVKLMSREAIDGMRVPINNGPDMLLGPGAIGAGVLLNRNGVFGTTENSFGNCGFGGSSGFADLDLKLSAGYVPNKMFPNLMNDPRAKALHAAAVVCASA